MLSELFRLVDQGQSRSALLAHHRGHMHGGGWTWSRDDFDRCSLREPSAIKMHLCSSAHLGGNIRDKQHLEMLALHA